jgi:hypothetical protein
LGYRAQHSPSEGIIAPVLARNRDKIFLASKSDALDYEGFKRDLDRSLQVLRTDYIDLYHLQDMQPHEEIIDRQTEPWGIKVTAVEVRDVVLPDSMKRAMAGQAESERERRAKIINAEGEFQAAEKLVQAASMISAQPARFLNVSLEFEKTRDLRLTRQIYFHAHQIAPPWRPAIAIGKKGRSFAVTFSKCRWKVPGRRRILHQRRAFNVRR